MSFCVASRIQPSCGLSEMTPLERVTAMRILIEHHGNAMREGAIIVVTGTRVRIRGREITESHDA